MIKDKSDDDVGHGIDRKKGTFAHGQQRTDESEIASALTVQSFSVIIQLSYSLFFQFYKGLGTGLNNLHPYNEYKQ